MNIQRELDIIIFEKEKKWKTYMDYNHLLSIKLGL